MGLFGNSFDYSNLSSEEALCKAIENIDLKKVKELLPQNNFALLHYRDGNGNTPLHLAYQKGKSCKAIIDYLLNQAKRRLNNTSNSAWLNAQNQQGNTALHLACQNNEGGLSLINLLLKEAISINLKNQDGDNPLLLVIKWQNTDVVIELIKRLCEMGIQLQDADTQDRTALHWAILNFQGAAKDSLEDTVLSCLLQQAEKKLKNNVNNLFFPWLNAKNKYGDTALHLACRGISNKTNYDELSSEEKAEWSIEFLRLIKFLLEKGANLFEKNNDGKTPLLIAVELGREPIFIKELIDKVPFEKRSNYCKMVDKEGNTLLHLALSGFRNTKKLLEFLFEAKVAAWQLIAIANNKERQSPLHDLVSKGVINRGFSAEILQIFLTNRGINLRIHCNVVNIYLQTPLYLAVKQSHGPLVNLLLDHVANINARDMEGDTALHKAIKMAKESAQYDQDIIRTLLNKGADPDAYNYAMQTPRSLAKDISYLSGIQSHFSVKTNDQADWKIELAQRLQAHDEQYPALYQALMQTVDTLLSSLSMSSDYREKTHQIKIACDFFYKNYQQPGQCDHRPFFNDQVKPKELEYTVWYKPFDDVRFIYRLKKDFQEIVQLIYSIVAGGEIVQLGLAMEADATVFLKKIARAGEQIDKFLDMSLERIYDIPRVYCWKKLMQTSDSNNNQAVTASPEATNKDVPIFPKPPSTIIVSQDTVPLFQPQMTYVELLKKIAVLLNDPLLRTWLGHTKRFVTLMEQVSNELIHIEKESLVVVKPEQRNNYFAALQWLLEEKKKREKDRKPKNRTEIGGKYVLVNKITKEDDEDLFQQIGKHFTESRMLVGKGYHSKLRIAREFYIDGQGKKHFGKFVAVKKIKEISNIEFSTEEANIQRKLQGESNIMPLLDSFETQDSKKEPVLYLFLPLAEFGDGNALKQALKYLDRENQELKNKLLIYVTKQWLIGLYNMHKRDIYHLDVCPGNIVIKGGELFVIDFGCAKVSTDSLMKVPARGNTYYYAPERIKFMIGEPVLSAPKNFQHASEIPKDYSNTPLASLVGDTGSTPIISNTVKSKKSDDMFFDAMKADAWGLGLALLEIAIGWDVFDRPRLKCGKDNPNGPFSRPWDEQYFIEKLATVAELQQPESSSLFSIIKGLLEVNPAKRLTIEQALNDPILQDSRYAFSSKDEVQQIFLDLQQKINCNQDESVDNDVTTILHEEENKVGNNQVEEIPYNNVVPTINDAIKISMEDVQCDSKLSVTTMVEEVTERNNEILLRSSVDLSQTNEVIFYHTILIQLQTIFTNYQALLSEEITPDLGQQAAITPFMELFKDMPLESFRAILSTVSSWEVNKTLKGVALGNCAQEIAKLLTEMCSEQLKILPTEEENRIPLAKQMAAYAALVILEVLLRKQTQRHIKPNEPLAEQLVAIVFQEPRGVMLSIWHRINPDQLIAREKQCWNISDAFVKAGIKTKEDKCYQNFSTEPRQYDFRLDTEKEIEKKKSFLTQRSQPTAPVSTATAVSCLFASSRRRSIEVQQNLLVHKNTVIQNDVIFNSNNEPSSVFASQIIMMPAPRNDTNSNVINSSKSIDVIYQL